MGKAFKLDNEVLSASINTLSGNLDTHAAKAASSSALGHVKTGTGITNSSGTISVSYGTAAGTACQGNDSRLSNSRTPVAHATSATTYGGGTASNYGHVKLSDSYTSSGGAASASVAASSKAVYDAYTALKNSFQDGVDTIYNAFVSAGTTPTAKTPAALSTAVTTLKNETTTNVKNSSYNLFSGTGTFTLKSMPRLMLNFTQGSTEDDGYYFASGFKFDSSVSTTKYTSYHSNNWYAATTSRDVGTAWDYWTTYIKSISDSSLVLACSNDGVYRTSLTLVVY